MKVASFNVQKFGKTKLSDPTVLSNLIKIVSRYDICVILEVVDSCEKDVEDFLEGLNKANPTQHYSKKISKPLGRTMYKEQFMFLYRHDLVNVIDTYQYEDKKPGNEDAFEREPYTLRFSCPKAAVKDLVMIAVHTKPVDAKKELDALYDVVQVVKSKWETDNIMILGDFNADGRYLSQQKLKTLQIFTDENFHWLIVDKMDTTTSTKNDHTYDRIVVYGHHLFDAVVQNLAKAFNFQKEYGLNDADAKKVSDHYPVEVELK